MWTTVPFLFTLMRLMWLVMRAMLAAISVKGLLRMSALLAKGTGFCRGISVLRGVLGLRLQEI